MDNLLLRAKHAFYLSPAIALLLTWIITAPALVAQHSISVLVVFTLAVAVAVAWCITLFAHALLRDSA